MVDLPFAVTFVTALRGQLCRDPSRLRWCRGGPQVQAGRLVYVHAAWRRRGQVVVVLEADGARLLDHADRAAAVLPWEEYRDGAGPVGGDIPVWWTFGGWPGGYEGHPDVARFVLGVSGLHGRTARWWLADADRCSVRRELLRALTAELAGDATLRAALEAPVRVEAFAAVLSSRMMFRDALERSPGWAEALAALRGSG